MITTKRIFLALGALVTLLPLVGCKHHCCSRRDSCAPTPAACCPAPGAPGPLPPAGF